MKWTSLMRIAKALLAILVAFGFVDPQVSAQDTKAKTAPRNQGLAKAEVSRPRHFPRRIWAASDFEGPTRDFGWFGTPETENIPRYAGNATALRGGAERDFAAYFVGINPVPGPRMGKVNQVYFRYFLKGTDTAQVQHFNLSREDNHHIVVSGLASGKWSEVTLNFTEDSRRNDGSPGAMAEGDRMDDLKIFLGKARDGKTYEMVVDDIILFADDPSLPADTEPFPNRIIYLAAFDTGEKEKYWPGDFEILEKSSPPETYWRAAKAVKRENDKGKWIRLGISPPRPVGEVTKLRFRYYLDGASSMTVQIFDLTDGDNRHIRLEGLKMGAWETAYLDFSKDSRRNDGSDKPFPAGHKVDDLFFFVSPESDKQVELLIDEVVLFDAGKP
jgi:hypothetical protein